MKQKYKIGMLFIPLFVVFFLPWNLLATIRTVTNNQQISAVLQQASSGDTILIEPGEYKENLQIDISLIIIGKNEPQIRGSFNGNVILVRAPDTIIEGLVVRESGTRLLDDFAGIRIEADSVIVRHCTIKEPLHGIYVKGGNYTVIHDNYIEGRLDLISADRGNGIHLWNSRGNQVFRNEILNVRDGIYFSFADSTKVFENHIHHVRYGLHYMYSNHNIFFENLFERNVAGAALMYSKDIVFERNVFARCRGFRAYGILYQSMDYATAKNNLILDNSRGVFFDNSNFNNFFNNAVVDNDLAVQLMGNAEENQLINNDFVNNLSSLLVDNRKSHTVWSSDSGGNYWSDYRGYDLNGDGLGDIPHKIQNIFQVLETRIPEIRFYLFSPAAEILEIAEQAIPILELGTETDKTPLFRPVKNKKIPWNKTEELNFVPNRFAAMIFLGVSFVPVLFLLSISRRKRR